MRPMALVNGRCSLMPDVVRLCMVCEMRINNRVKVTSSRFYEGVMRSRARLTYSQVRRIMDIGDPELVERYGHVLSSLQALYDAYRMRLRLRERRGALDFDSQQAEFRFDEKGQVVDIDLQRRGDEHRLIEELMIAANVEAARFVGRQKLPMLRSEERRGGKEGGAAERSSG